MGAMSAMTSDNGIPAWDTSDRLAKALRHAGVRTGEMADYLGVSRNTIGNYTSGRTAPDLRTLRLWALRTGVPLEWLETGVAPHGPVGGAATIQYLPERTLVAA